MATTNAQYITDVVTYTNQERKKAGLPPLTVNSLLNKAAQTHSQNMALKDFYDHEGADGKYHDERIAATGYKAGYTSENIAAGYSTPKQAVNGWMDSSGHRYNILYPGTTEIGVGYYYLENDTGQEQSQSYWTQNFASPSTSSGGSWWDNYNIEDWIYGDDNNNTLQGNNKNSGYIDSPGNDIVKGLAGNDYFWNDAGNDTFYGGAGNDTVGDGCQFVDRGSNLFYGGDGKDQVNGGNGQDTLYGDSGNDWIDGGYNNDVLYGGLGNDIMWGGAYYLYSNIPPDNDTLYGQGGNDLISGQAGDDYLVGGKGHDRIWGDDEIDTLIGIEPQDAQPGKGERDTLNSYEKYYPEKDTFVLGDTSKIYYNDGDNTKSGKGDYALIQYFDPNTDVIQLHGKASDYSLRKSPAGMPSGRAIFLETGAVDELIGIVQLDGNSTNFSLTASCFKFV